MVWSRKLVIPPLPPELLESAFKLSGDIPVTVQLGAEGMKERKPEDGEHAANI